MRRPVILLAGLSLAVPLLGGVAEAAVAPVNDNFADATVLSGETASTTGTNVDATLEPGEPDHWDSTSAEASVWHRWQAPRAGRVTIDTCASDFNTVLAVYTGTTLNGLTKRTSNNDDDACPGSQSRVELEVTTGTVYHIAVDGYGGFDEGTVGLSIALGSSSGDLAVAGTLDFGRVAVGRSTERTLVVRNVGAGPLTVSAVALKGYAFAAGEYKVVSNTAVGTIPAGAERYVVIRFTPGPSPSGAARPTSYFDLPDGLALLTKSTDDTLESHDVWHYFRNLGGRGTLGYRAVSSNDFGAGLVAKAAKSGTATLVAGDYYAARATSPWIGAAEEARQDLFMPSATRISRRSFSPLYAGAYVDALDAVTAVRFERLGDAMLVITSNDPALSPPADPYRFEPEAPQKVAVRLLGEGRAVCAGYATDSRNQVVGSSANNRLVGTAAPDIICGLGGADTLLGKGGGDLLIGGNGKDKMYGGPGADRFMARDGKVDVVSGGPGRDVAQLDRIDRVKGVEVRRLR